MSNVRAHRELLRNLAKAASIKPPQLRIARVHEYDVAALLGGRRVPMSGGKPGDMGGDVVVRVGDKQLSLTVECKATHRRSMSIQADWLAKIASEAIARGSEPAFSFRFHGQPDLSGVDTWIAVPAHTFRRLLEP